MNNKFQIKIFLNLIRVLFPRWNFFDQVAFTFELQFKTENIKKWQKIKFESSRKKSSLYLNPDINELLAQFNIIEHFARDIQELDFKNREEQLRKVKQLTTYKMICSLLSLKLQESEFNFSEEVFLKIVAVSTTDRIDLFESDLIRMEIK